jgi:hypothetical protein
VAAEGGRRGAGVGEGEELGSGKGCLRGCVAEGVGGAEGSTTGVKDIQDFMTCWEIVKVETKL